MCDKGCSGSLHEAAHSLFLLLFDPAKCHGQHHQHGKTHAQFHFRQPSDEVMLKTKGYIEPTVDSFYRRALLVEVLALVRAACQRSEHSSMFIQLDSNTALDLALAFPMTRCVPTTCSPITATGTCSRGTRPRSGSRRLRCPGSGRLNPRAPGSHLPPISIPRHTRRTPSGSLGERLRLSLRNDLDNSAV